MRDSHLDEPRRERGGVQFHLDKQGDERVIPSLLSKPRAWSRDVSHPTRPLVICCGSQVHVQ